MERLARIIAHILEFILCAFTFSIEWFNRNLSRLPISRYLFHRPSLAECAEILISVWERSGWTYSEGITSFSIQRDPASKRICETLSHMGYLIINRDELRVGDIVLRSKETGGPISLTVRNELIFPDTSKGFRFAIECQNVYNKSFTFKVCIMKMLA